MDIFGRALQAIGTIQDARERDIALSDLFAIRRETMPIPDAQRIIERIRDPERRDDILYNLSIRQGMGIQPALQFIERIQNETVRGNASSDLVRRTDLPIQRARQIIEGIRDPWISDSAFSNLAGRDDIPINHALQAIGRIRGLTERDTALIRLSLSQRDELSLEMRQRITENIHDPRMSDHTLRALIDRYPDLPVARVQRIIERIRDPRTRDVASFNLATRRDLPIQRARQIIGRIQDPRRRADALGQVSARQAQAEERAVSILSRLSTMPPQPPKRSEIDIRLARIRELGGEQAIEQLLQDYPYIFDPIRFTIMKNPTQVGTGIMYDQQSAKDLISKSGGRCAMTRRPMTNPVRNTPFYNTIINILDERIRQLEGRRQRQKQQVDDPRQRQRLIRQYRRLNPNASPRQLADFQGRNLPAMIRINARLSRLEKRQREEDDNDSDEKDAKR